MIIYVSSPEREYDKCKVSVKFNIISRYVTGSKINLVLKKQRYKEIRII